MDFLRKHWYNVGGAFAILLIILMLVGRHHLTGYQLLMWASLTSLLLHQFEEYHFPGNFPRMLNKVMFQSSMPDHYPLNSNTALIINAGIGWTTYFLAAAVGEHAVWLGMATIFVSMGNTVVHTIVFNVKGKTFYNAGMFSAMLLFIPCTYFFFTIVKQGQLATTFDYLLGIALGIVLNLFGVFKMIVWLADKDSLYIFPERS